MRPATRIGRWILCPGGKCYKLTYIEYFLILARLKRTVKV